MQHIVERCLYVYSAVEKPVVGRTEVLRWKLDMRCQIVGTTAIMKQIMELHRMPALSST